MTTSTIILSLVIAVSTYATMIGEIINSSTVISKQVLKHSENFAAFRSRVSVNNTQPQLSGNTNAKFLFPSCINVTLDPAYFTYVEEKNELTTSIGYQSVTFQNYPSIDKDTSATVCHPLSPQLLTCSIIQYKVDFFEFHLENYTLYTNNGRNVTFLGDYFLTSNGEPILCQDTINYAARSPSVSMPRCNYVTVGLNELQITDNTLHLKRGGQTIARSDLLVTLAGEGQNIPYHPAGARNICYPLSFSLLGCKDIQIVPANYVTKMYDHRLRVDAYNDVLELSEFYYQDRNNVVICKPRNRQPIYLTIMAAYFSFRVTTAVFLVLTILYLCGPERPNHHVKYQVCHLTCLLLMYGLEIFRSIHLTLINDPFVCYTYYVLVYLGNMCAFFWLHVLAYDAHCVVSNMQTSTFNCLTNRFSIKRRFAKCCLYAWGTPILMCGVSLALEFSESMQRALGIFPDILDGCWLFESTSHWIFYNGPLLVIMGSNTIFFALAIGNIVYSSKGDILGNRKKHLELFAICFKLYILMGLCWIPKLISWTMVDSGWADYWYIIKPFTSLQGVAIFIVYVCNRQNYDKIRLRLC